ncbi:OmpH family outer membrane protein [Roseomonas sp. PWR1]|uniref:OmpH family outer membrane protein n=1 Tax=Roseomonas nitratireducens TaxID=2820810 RepID=A0ABS4AVZ1_9PROT|nr:OmpH family outer membrane protein [Neoroseomonas nitratireducens]MBP0465516.1 OmpH family outer membrane protein [Neoroseomonas nitratireducens]
MSRIVSAALAGLLVALPAAAQQGGQQWFVPGQGQQPGQQGQGQQRPPQQGQQGQRPPAQPQQPAQRPVQAPPPLAPGQPPPTAVIGIVDVPEIQRVSSAFTQVREEIERRRASLNDDLQREQLRWREEQQRLATERGAMTPEQLRVRERELQDRITDSQRALRDRAASIEQVAQGALREIEQALGTVIRQVASSRSVNIVLPRPLVIFNEPPFDLTTEVAAQLNRMIPSVTLPAEAAPAPAQAAQPQPARPAGGQGQQPRRN